MDARDKQADPNWPIIYALARAALATRSPACLQHVERLKDALGSSDNARQLTELLATRLQESNAALARVIPSSAHPAPDGLEGGPEGSSDLPFWLQDDPAPVPSGVPFEEWLDRWLRNHPEVVEYDKEAMRDAFMGGRQLEARAGASATSASLTSGGS